MGCLVPCLGFVFQGREDEFRHSLVFQNLYHIGDTKSAQELEVFLRMAPERLRLCCGIHKLHCMLPWRHFSALRTDMSWRLCALLCKPCVKGVLEWLSVEYLELCKTRSAAALLAGLLVFDPSLELMVLTIFFFFAGAVRARSSDILPTSQSLRAFHSKGIYYPPFLM